MRELCGTHGTTAENAACIRREGFQISRGRAGTGVYFWAKSRFAVSLAWAWARQCRDGKNGKERIAVIHGCIRLRTDEEFLDLEDLSMKDLLVDTASKLGILNDDRKESLCRCFDFLVRQIEEETGVSIRAFQSRLAPPDSRYFEGEKYPLKLIGAPIGYIVKDPGCINVVRVEEEQS